MMKRCVFCGFVLMLMLTGGLLASVPVPVYDAEPGYVEMYARAWDIARGRIHFTKGLPSECYMDENLVETDIWIWDSAFMSQFCKYAPWEFPGIETLDNFYGILLQEPGIKVPMVRNDCPWLQQAGEFIPLCVHIPDNPPILAWAEWDYAKRTADVGRLRRLLAPEGRLIRYYRLIETMQPGWVAYGVRNPATIRKTEKGYHWAGGQSGMDNTPRGRSGMSFKGERPDNPDLLWVDLIAQQALAAVTIAEMYRQLGDQGSERQWRQEFAEKSAVVNRFYWDDDDGFYYDIFESSGKFCKVMTPASFWVMLAGAAPQDRAVRMAEKLRKGGALFAEGGVPTLSVKDADYSEGGKYWRGSIWLPTAYMTVKALERYGMCGHARELAERVIRHQYRTYKSVEPHTIWECYKPNRPEPATGAGAPGSGRDHVAPDFCGWSALGPISLFIENVIGIRSANAFTHTVVWDLPLVNAGNAGVRDYRFGNVVCDLIYDGRFVHVRSNASFTLIANGVSHQVGPGSQEIDISVFKKDANSACGSCSDRESEL